MGIYLCQLGVSGAEVSVVGPGCMQFSNRGFISFAYPALEQSLVGEIVTAAHDGGITCFDTAEIYRRGTSERCLSMGPQHVLETARRLGVTLIAYSPLASAC